ncbi:alpha/beta hydrolase [Vibrio variabilis]|uniref:alpha/beta hydrolase n=1 Tax=Vibrio variabilis TaxID=990271 RepID=UPI000DDBC0CA|nr:alpha/beta hydrolase [Vibrio variabilis]
MRKTRAHNYIAPMEMTFDEFPESKLTADGMKVINADYSLPYSKVEKVQYAEKSEMALHLNMITPTFTEESINKLPLILYVQGSAWLQQNLESKIVQLGKFSERGYIVAIVEYRPTTVAPFPAQIKDAKTAYRYLVSHAEQYNIDTDKIIIWGDSSGGHTASMVGLTMTEAKLDDESPSELPINIKAVINYYGPTDITQMHNEPSTCDHQTPNSPEGRLIGGRAVYEHTELASKTNPMNYVDKHKEIPPFLIFHGSKDRLVPFGQSVLLFEALKKAEKEVEFYQLKGADHGNAPFWTPQVLDIVDNFISEHIKN